MFQMNYQYMYEVNKRSKQHRSKCLCKELMVSLPYINAYRKLVLHIPISMSTRTTSLCISSYIFWSSGIMDCMLFQFEKGPLMHQGRWWCCIVLTIGAIFPSMQAIRTEDFFHSPHMSHSSKYYIFYIFILYSLLLYFII